VLAMKEDFMYTMDIFLHERDRFLYYREDDMPDMARIDTSRLKYEVQAHKLMEIIFLLYEKFFYP
jgi:hypothetical protein